MNTRLKQFLAAENISQSQFADTIGVARASISHILSGRNKPGFDFLTSLARHYPSLNLGWLITGRGRMYSGLQDDAPGYLYSAPSAINAESDDEEQPAAEGELFASADTRNAVLSAGEADFGRQSPAAERPVNSKSAGSPAQHQKNADLAGISQTRPATPAGRRISRVVVFYDDNTYEELK